MKNFLRPLKLACLAAASMLIVSCGGSADYRSILPADSFMTVSVNYGQTNEKYKENSRKSSTADREPTTYSRASNFGSQNEM